MLEKIENVLNANEKDFSEFALNEMIKRWEIAKAPLIEILSKHSCWNNDIKAVILQYQEYRNNNERFYNLRRLLNYVEANVNISDEIKKVLNEIETWDLLQFLDSEVIHCIANISSLFSFKEGMKTSRAINKILCYIGADQLEEYNKLFAIFADSVNPLMIERTAVLSVNPVDFLLMSNGTGWKSCHNIFSGEYMAGTLSYMGDRSSMIFYTVEENNEKFIPLNPKITRNIFCYTDGKLLQSRLYPDNSETLKENYRQIVQKIFAECLELPNLWKLEKDFLSVKEFIITSPDGLHYKDYNYDCYSPNISSLKDYQQNGEKIVIGSTCHCIECDCAFHFSDSLSCCSRCFECENCGCSLNEDDIYWVDGSAYCQDCVSFCDHCQNYVIEELTYINAQDEYVCADCLERYYIKCDECGNYHYNGDSNYISYSDMNVCDDCFENYFQCNQCGDFFPIEEENIENDESYCSCCFEELKEKEEATLEVVK